MNTEFIIYQDSEYKPLLFVPDILSDKLKEMSLNIYDAFRYDETISISHAFHIDHNKKIFDKLPNYINFDKKILKMNPTHIVYNQLFCIPDEYTGILFKPFTIGNIQKSIQEIKKRLCIEDNDWRCYCV